MAIVDVSPEDFWIEKFDEVFDDILNHRHTNYTFPGGRGSTKSSFISLVIPILIMQHPDIHCCIFRKVGNTLKGSVYGQIQWAINQLGVYNYFIFHTNPLEIIYKPTKQKIMFLGLDDPGKVKSIKLPFGYIGINWFEELDQYSGPQEIRKVLQSTMRGGDMYWNFRSYNPPISINNWANEDTEESEKFRQGDTLVTRTTYLDVPIDWLGQAFIDEAEYLQSVNERAYTNEYLGIPVGTGGNIFDNVEHMDMSWELINTWDNVYNGLDWGYANDPNMFVKMYFDKTRKDLYIFAEHRRTHESNAQLYESLYKEDKLVRFKLDENDEKVKFYAPLMELNELITADSAELKSIGDFKSWGAYMRESRKGPESVRYGIKWLQSLRHIYIDKYKCPFTYDEFVKYEFDRDKDGNIISSYPDENNHSIDAVRYALERFYNKRGN